MPTIEEFEEINGAAAVAWADAQSQHTLAQLEDDEYAQLHTQSLKILEAKDKLPAVTCLLDDNLYNHWQDDEHVQGLWRRTTIRQYQKPNPGDIQWEVLLDLDALSAKEGETWVFNEANVFEPDCKRALISLSRGGGDATVMREFCMRRKEFIPADLGGFNLPEAKQDMDWLDHDTVLVKTDFGPDSMTESSYPRTVKLWRRGQPLAEAQTILTVDQTHVSAGFGIYHNAQNEVCCILEDSITFYRQKTYVFRDNALNTVNIPDDCQLTGVFNDQLLMLLRSDWRDFVKGSLVAVEIATMTGAHPNVTLLKAPTATLTIQDASATRSCILVQVLDNIRGCLYRLDPTAPGKWQETKLEWPTTGCLTLGSADPRSDYHLVDFEDDLTPNTVYWAKRGNLITKLKSAPARFDSSQCISEQWGATSKDGTRIPYTILYQKTTKFDGSNPTILWGYGGFEIPIVPTYTALTGKLWIESGNVYVLANIRGGGEFGPAWHQAALKTKRQTAYDDFIAVAEDLIARGVTSPAHLGIRGGSNGGLLVAAVMVQRPDLYRAIVCNVPLTDMLRYHKLNAGAGASWMGEYGDPDDTSKPEERAAIVKYSPLQNVKPSSDAAYQDILLMTSTMDDRVHPYHARAFADALTQNGHDDTTLYYEDRLGGHGGNSNMKQLAKEYALQFRFLRMKLGAKPLAADDVAAADRGKLARLGA